MCSRSLDRDFSNSIYMVFTSFCLLSMNKWAMSACGASVMPGISGALGLADPGLITLVLNPFIFDEIFLTYDYPYALYDNIKPIEKPAFIILHSLGKFI